MSVKPISELLDSVNSIIGDNNDDSTLEFIGDLSDTLNSFKDSESQIETLKREKSELDSSWRKKYRERFFSPAPAEEEPPNDEPALKTKFEDLFS